MILYVRSINTCQQIFNWILDELQDKIFCGEKIPENRFVEMFHASTDEESKERMMESFICPSGQLKLLISTAAFGMGVNIPDVDLVLHWGIPPISPFILAGDWSLCQGWTRWICNMLCL